MSDEGRRRRSFMGVAWLTAIGLSGCGGGDPGAVPAVPAAGSVKYKGKSVEEGTIQFVPENGRPAQGAITNGHFTLSTYREQDGAVPGEHKVGVVATQEVKMKGAESDVKYLVPEKYADPQESGIEVTIPPEGDMNIAIDIPG